MMTAAISPVSGDTRLAKTTRSCAHLAITRPTAYACLELAVIGMFESSLKESVAAW